MKNSIVGKSYIEIKELVLGLNGNISHAIRISKWLYSKDILCIDDIITIPLTLRNGLNQNYCIGKYNPIHISESLDKTKKYLFENFQGQRFESVYMPSSKRNTLCISTQSGCRMGCTFCHTGKIDFKGNLAAQDILNQYLSIPERSKVNRIVIMGMGEPFDNFMEVKKAVEILTAEWGSAFGSSNITLSSVGLHEPLKAFLLNPFCNLAISLNNPISDERKVLMPIEKTNPIIETINLIKANPLQKPLRMSFEYVALGETNLTEKHAIAISKLLNGLKCHLNIIPWNIHEGSSFKTPSETELNAFINCLNSNGVLTAIRQSRGQDIGAACGQMAGGNEQLRMNN